MDHFRRVTALGGHNLQDQKQWHRMVTGMFPDIRQEMMMMRNRASPHLLQDPAQLQLQHQLWDCQQTTAPVPVGARQFLTTHLIPPLKPQLNSMPPIDYIASGHNSQHTAIVAQQREIFNRKNNARLEVNAMLRQKELVNSQHKRPAVFGYPIIQQGPGILPNVIPFWVPQHLQEGHLPNHMHCASQEELQASNLVQCPRPYRPTSVQQRMRLMGRKGLRRLAARSSSGNGKSQWEDGRTVASGMETEGLGEQEGGDHSGTGLRNGKNSMENEHGNSQQDDCVHGEDRNTSSALLKTSLCSSPFVLPTELPCKQQACPATGKELSNGSRGSPLSGGMVEELRKWTVEDVYCFIKDIPGCSVYAEVFKDHCIDGETLPLLTDDHLLETLGIKLGPALKIRSQVLRHLRSTFSLMCPITAPAPRYMPAGRGERAACQRPAP